ncbi:hypothetical protein [Gordonia sp. 852002-51296_SCH5728562-b]|uniref:hypothetical protein n=1 Tax=Gordonia sp. 852002-51296_SCH5728562-b TaxID=1834101 RepID=UPI0007EA2C13|nr:hypothetical protein [Gordonia sp. 852002-51296_SCH5728562-b]OBA35710.1 hypothetical protein A5766_09415 [Gordonia sp. 852002-51296_SCH5728562-b]
MDIQITTRTAAPLTSGQIADQFTIAGLVVDDARLSANAETYAATLALIRQASVIGLGETPPAVAFNASWT